MSIRRILVGAAVLALVGATIGVGMAVAGPEPSNHIGAGHSVSTKGRSFIEPNVQIQSTLHFSPERIVVETGEQVRWQWRDEDSDPHTATIVRRSDLPQDVGGVFECEPCNEALEAHESGGLTKKVEDDADGEEGLDGAGDSLLLFPGDPVTRHVTAPAGTRLYYLCAIHPWMQGKIRVE